MRTMVFGRKATIAAVAAPALMSRLSLNASRATDTASAAPGCCQRAWPLMPHSSVPHAKVAVTSTARRRVVSRVSSTKITATQNADAIAAVSIPASIHTPQSVGFAPKAPKSATAGTARTLAALGARLTRWPPGPGVTMNGCLPACCWMSGK